MFQFLQTCSLINSINGQQQFNMQPSSSQKGNQATRSRCPKCLSHVPQALYNVHLSRCRPARPSRRQALAKQQKQSKWLENHIQGCCPPESAKRKGVNSAERFPCHLCGYQQTMIQLDSHFKSCPNRQTTCSFCNQNFPRNILIHHIKVCSKRQGRNVSLYQARFNRILDQVNVFQPSMGNRAQSPQNEITFGRSLRGSIFDTAAEPALQKKERLGRQNLTAGDKCQSNRNLQLQNRNQQSRQSRSNESLEISSDSQPQVSQRSRERQNYSQSSERLNYSRQHMQTFQLPTISHHRNYRQEYIAPRRRCIFNNWHQPQRVFQEPRGFQSINPFRRIGFQQANRILSSVNPQSRTSIPPRRSVLRFQLSENPNAEDFRPLDSISSAQRISRLLRVAEFNVYNNGLEAQIRIAAARLDERNIGGLTQRQIQMIPNLAYKDSRTEEKDTCCICYCDFSNSDQIKDLTCKHLFHINCITQWLKKNKLCPLCKKDTSTSISQKDQKGDNLQRKDRQPRTKFTTSQVDELQVERNEVPQNWRLQWFDDQRVSQTSENEDSESVEETGRFGQ